MPVIPALGRQKQEDHEFKARLDYIARHCLKPQSHQKKKKKRALSQNKNKVFRRIT
jgi:hypothetical protein